MIRVPKKWWADRHNRHVMVSNKYVIHSDFAIARTSLSDARMAKLRSDMASQKGFAESAVECQDREGDVDRMMAACSEGAELQASRILYDGGESVFRLFASTLGEAQLWIDEEYVRGLDLRWRILIGGGSFARTADSSILVAGVRHVRALNGALYNVAMPQSRGECSKEK